MTPSSNAIPGAVAFDAAESVATLTVGTGARFNAMGREEWRDLERSALALATLASLQAVVIRGEGGTFSSGSDLREWAGIPLEEVSESFAEIEAALQAIEAIPVPTVAVVEGIAAGGGCQLALACDVQLMTDSARIGMPTAQLGILVPAAFATRMSLRIGPSRTKNLLYNGRLLTSAQACGMGLITTSVATAQLEKTLNDLLSRWAAQSAASLRAAKTAVNQGLAPLTQAARSFTDVDTADSQEFPHRLASFLHHPKR
ncbi:MAG TPA: enoyl-CoA hydratase/isomerase family protein [Microbacteriaceae bacterium]